MLARHLPTSNTVAEAGRKAGMSKQAAHDAYKALEVKAPQRCAQLGINRDKVLLRFDQWAENATEVVTASMFGKVTDVKEVTSIALRMRANDKLAKIMGCYADEKADSPVTMNTQILNLVHLTDEQLGDALSAIDRILAQARTAETVQP